ncbi:DUF4215 domain-containing protein [Vulgatibacter sp.]|uniref:DUF4215 domain-containing protein n=1 Tax=Vulgatibacter sp. TaxID=1971226 RepID=UPI003569FF0D
MRSTAKRIFALAVLSLQLAGCSDDPDVDCSGGSCEGVCGDGVVSASVEECDDGNEDDADACVHCRLARCGDGTVQTGAEACDDGERNSDAETGACRSDCTLPQCGDGVVDPGESCDDGNAADDDGCDADCSFPDVVQLASGLGNNCALFDAGNVRCWGSNGFGELGYGLEEILGDDEPAGAFGDVDTGGRAVQLAMGGRHACVLLETGSVRCWGRNHRGQLGPGSTDTTVGDEPGEMPPPELPLGNGAATAIFASPWQSCVLLDDREVHCWGTPPPSRNHRLEVLGQFGVVRQLAIGDFHGCALFEAGNVKCWTSTTTGYPGYGSIAPVAVEDADDVNLGGAALQLSLAYEHACAVLENGSVYCWGNGADGRLGSGSVETIGDDETPADAGPVELGEPAVQVAVGRSHTCALLATGKVRCWGRLAEGQLGYGDMFDRTDPEGSSFALGDEPGEMPPPDVDIGGKAVQLIAGFDHTCALLEHGGVRCWGGGDYQYVLGYGQDVSLGEPPTNAGDVPLYPQPSP